MSPNSLVKAEASTLGFDLVGVSAPGGLVGGDFTQKWIEKGYHGPMDYLATSLPLRQDLNAVLPGVRSVICVGLNYNQPNPALPGEPRIARYALGRDYHKVIRGKLRRLASRLEPEFPGETWRACVDSAPVFERELAHLAGLGWFGKNTCLINSRQGSWFLIGTLLTTALIERDDPAEGGCGTCRLCIDACPTQCIVYEDDRWQVDARRCISTLTIEHKEPWQSGVGDLVGDWTFGCDVCQEVCPFNHPRASQPERARVTTEPDFLAKKTWPNLRQLAQISPGDWDSLTQGSATRRIGYEGIKRNAAQNLANGDNLGSDS